MPREIKTIFSIDGEQKYKDAIKSINKEQSLLRAETKAATDQFDASGDSQKRLAAQAESLAKQIELQKKKIAEAQNAVEQSNRIYGEADDKTKGYKIELANAEAALGRLQTQLAKTNKELIEQNSSLLKVGDSLEKTGKKMETVGDGIGKVGKTLSVGVTAPIMAAGAGLLDLGNKFDDAVDTIRIGTGKTGDALKGLESDFEEVIGNVPADMDKAASAITDLNQRLGLTGEPLQDLAQQYLELSHITKEDMPTSITNTTRAFQAWNIPAEKMSQGLDTIFKVSQATGIKVNELAQKVTDFAPALQDLGFTFEQSAALIGKFEQSGVNTDTVLSAMKKSLSEFAKEGKNASQGLAEITANIKGAKTESEAAQIAIEVFGAKAGPELAHQIRAGKLDIDDFTKSISNSTETINGAATDTYDYAEQWKMLSNRLAKDLKPVAEQVFKAINSATPILEDAAKWIGNLAQEFSELSPQQQETILKMIALAAAAGPVLSVTSKLTTTVGGVSQAIGGFIKKLAEKKAAEEAAKLATEGLAGSTGGFLSSISPAGAAIGGVALVLGGLALAYDAVTKPAREAGEAGKAFAEGIASWHDGVEQATSVLQGFNMETIISGDKMSEFEDKIKTAQDNILKIAETAASESRKYTQAEQEEITKLIGMIADYTQKKMEAYQQQARVVEAMATQEKDITLQRSQELIKGAEDAKSQTLAIAQTQYTDLVAEAEKLYGHLGEKDKESYNSKVQTAQSIYDNEISMANKTYGDTLSVIQKKYADFNSEDMKHLEKIADISSQLEGLESKKNEMLKQKMEERKEQLHTETLSTDEQAKLQFQTENWYNGEHKRLIDELAQSYKKANADDLASWLGMVMNTELYGGKVDEKTKQTARGIIGSFESLPDDSKQKIAEMLQGMEKKMQDSEPELFQNALNLTNGVISGLNKSDFAIKVGWELAPFPDIKEAIGNQTYGHGHALVQYASGTNNAPGGMALVGEEGPEVMYVPKHAQIVNNNDLGKAFDSLRQLVDETNYIADMQRYISDRVSSSGLGNQIIGAQRDISGEQGLLYASKNAKTAPDYRSDLSEGGKAGDINIQNMIVRNDNDIKLIARELYNLQQSRRRAVGVSK